MSALPASGWAALGLIALLPSCARRHPEGRARGDASVARADAATSTAGAAKPPAPELTQPRFSDVTEAAGIRFVHQSGRSGRRYYVEPHSGGCAALDADGDGLTDLYAVDGGPLPGYRGAAKRSNRLFRNRGDGTFEDWTARAGLAGRGYGFGAYAADYDGDGDDDLFLTSFGADLLYRNRGDGTFEEVGVKAGVAGTDRGQDHTWSTGAAWLDADGDGDLDLWLTAYVVWTPASDRACWRRGVRNYCAPYDYRAAGDRLYLNQGDGTFTDGSRAAGVLPATGKGLGAMAYDLDADGRPEVYVVNDETPNLLYHNLGGGRFEEIGLTAGVAVNGNGGVQAGMGVDAGDLDGDGRPDIVVSNFQDEPIDDYRQRSPLMFSDQALVSGLGAASARTLGFAVLLFDADLDADLDVFVANGHVWDNIEAIEPHHTYGQRNILGRNDGRGHLEDVAERAGPAFRREDVSRSGCLLDYDGDGDLDLFVVNLDAPARLLRNDTPRGDRHWLGLRLEGRGANRQALGARYEVVAGGRRQVGQMWRIRGYLSTSQRTIHLGLGAASRVDRLEIVWPGGARTTRHDLPVDRVHTLTQPAPDQKAKRRSP